MTISHATYYSYRLRQLTGIPLTRICEVASEIAYETLIENPELLRETRRKYAVRTPERQLEIDLSRGYVRLVPLEYYDLEAKELRKVILFQETADSPARGYEKMVP
jgi:hypothetical protein